MTGKVGITDVASAAGVSISTVSLALNDDGRGRISPETRERIRRIVESMGYVPNRLARASVAAARHLLERHDRPTGLFCFNDRMAMGSYRAAAELDLRIPLELSVVGYDNHYDIAAGLFPGLTTVQLPHYEMGVWAAQRLLDLIAAKNGSAKHARLRGKLIRRESVTSPPPR